MEIVENKIIIAILLIAATLSSASAAITSYATQQELERDYALLENRYVELSSYIIRTELADYMMLMEY